MSERAPPRASAERNWITVVAAGVFVATMAVFNVAGWAVTWKDSAFFLGLFCVIAVGSEVLAANLAIQAERAHRSASKAKVAGLLFALAICLAINGVGGHNAWSRFEAMMFAPQVAAAQAEIDARRASLQLAVADYDRQIEVARPPVEMSAGPLGRAEARRVYEIELARLQPLRNAAQERLDTQPIAAPERHVAPEWIVWTVFGLIQLMMAQMFWAIGAGATSKAPVSGAMAPVTDEEALPGAPDAPRVKERSRQPTPEQAEDLAYLRGIDPKLASAWRLIRVEKRTPKGAAKELSAKSKTNVAAAVIARRLNAAEKALAERRANDLKERGVAVIRAA